MSFLGSSTTTATRQPPMHLRARPVSSASINQVFDLLADLQDSQISQLLDDINCTAPSNVPVSQAIALFETPTSASAASPPSAAARLAPQFTHSNPLRSNPPNHVRQLGKRISSAPEPTTRLRTFAKDAAPRLPTLPADKPYQTPTQRDSTPRLPALDFDEDSATMRMSMIRADPEEPSRPAVTTPTSPANKRQSIRHMPSVPVLSIPTSPYSATSFGDSPVGATSDEDNHDAFSSRPVSPAVSTPQSYVSTASSTFQRARHYKRISRPLLALQPAKSTPDLRQLVAAYFDEGDRPKMPSRLTPSMAGLRPPPTLYGARVPEEQSPLADLLEPQPSRKVSFAELRGAAVASEPTDGMSGIFELLLD